MNRLLTATARAGFTLVEGVISVALIGIAMGAALSGWIYMTKAERRTSYQAELDIDVRKSIESLREGIRRSAMEKIVLYPSGAGPYTAISFPQARDNDGDGMIESDANGLIIWDQTVIYHVWTGTPYSLLCTTFEHPEGITLTDVQRQEQLAYVVTHGNGAGTYNGGRATTKVVFQNLFQWNLSTAGGLYDTYAATTTREQTYFGSAILAAGNHDFKFTAVGRNPSSSGQKVALDTLTVSPSALPREVEAQTVVAQSGAAAYAEFMPQGLWSGNYQLTFPATANDHYFTLRMENDAWEDTNFYGAEASGDRTVVRFRDDLSPKDFVVQLQEGTNTWTAEQQTQSTVNYANDSVVANKMVRILLRGGDMLSGGCINNEGGYPLLFFRAAGWNGTSILGAWIAEAASSATPTMDIVGSTNRQLLFNGTSASCIFNGLAWAKPASALYINREKSYIVTIRFGNVYFGGVGYWTESSTNSPGCYLAAVSTAAAAADPIWSTNIANYAITSQKYLFSLDSMSVSYPTNGVFTSQVADTRTATPAYKQVTWHASVPSGTGLGLQVRSFNDNVDFSDAPAWSSCPMLTSGGAISPGTGRYIQYRATLSSDSTFRTTPVLTDVRINWAGPNQLVDIGGVVTKGSDGGIFNLTVDGVPLIRGVVINLTIFKQLYGTGMTTNMLTSSMSAEVEPRNTGK